MAELSQMSKNDISYISDLLEGKKQKVCRSCKKKIKEGEQHTWRTCSKWEDSHECLHCFKINDQRNHDVPDWVHKEFFETGCGRCDETYNPRERGLCFKCEIDTACHAHRYPSNTYYFGLARCSECWRLRVPYWRADYWKTNYGPWNSEWCYRCGGLQYNPIWLRDWVDDHDPFSLRRGDMRVCRCVSYDYKDVQAEYPEYYAQPEEDWYLDPS